MDSFSSHTTKQTNEKIAPSSMSTQRTGNVKRLQMHSRRTPFTSVRRRRVLSRPVVTPKISKRTSVHSFSQETMDNTLEAITDKTWHVHTCSPLHRFKMNPASLKRLSRLLSSVLAAKASKQSGVAMDAEMGIKANFTISKGIAILKEDSPALHLTICNKLNKIIAEFFFCALDSGSLVKACCPLRNTTNENKKAIKTNFTVLPLLLFKGAAANKKVVFNWMQAEFDCSIQRLGFNPLSLSWMLGMWSTIPAFNKKEKGTTVVWKIPLEHSGLDHIQAEFTPDSMAAMWRACHKGPSEEVLAEEVKRFVKGLQDHLCRHFNFKFNALPLMRVDMQIASVHMDGKVKIHSRDHVHTVLDHLSCLAVESLDWRLQGLQDQS